MTLLAKLLRSHISVPQFIGYFAANVIGMAVTLLSVQFYSDVAPLFKGEDSFLKAQVIVISKHIGTAGSMSNMSNSFTQAEENDLRSQSFAKKIGEFRSSGYRSTAAISVGGKDALTTDLFLDAVPDAFVSVSPDIWHYSAGDSIVPIILPRSYITLYNFGFAQSRGLPKISEGLAGMIDVRIFAGSGTHSGTFRGKVVGFSGRISSILVPMSFIDWSNARFAPDADNTPTRLIIESDSPADPAMHSYLDRMGYDISEGDMDAGKAVYFLRLVTGIVFFIGILICALSFFILMLSIYLLVEKNNYKIENLLLTGYSPLAASRPYINLSVAMNALVLVLSAVMLYFFRAHYLDELIPVFPEAGGEFMWSGLETGAVLFILVTVINTIAVRHKILSIWRSRLERPRKQTKK